MEERGRQRARRLKEKQEEEGERQGKDGAQIEGIHEESKNLKSLGRRHEGKQKGERREEGGIGSTRRLINGIIDEKGKE